LLLLLLVNNRLLKIAPEALTLANFGDLENTCTRSWTNDALSSLGYVLALTSIMWTSFYLSLVCGNCVHAT
jgi:hypothetical protein